MSNIRVIIVDDIKNTRESIRRLLSFDSGFEVIGEAGCGSDALKLIELLKPDIALMDINIPDIDGIKTTELLSFRVPETSVIMMSVQSDHEYMTKAMMAGSKAYIVKPFTGNELTSTILNVYHKEVRKRELNISSSIPNSEKNNSSAKINNSSAKIISVFSTKGGVGKTTIAVNLAIELAKSKFSKVLLMDLNLQFGDVASFLNLVPKKTITDIAQGNFIKEEEIRYHTLTHSSGVQVLAASIRPEYAEVVTASHIEQILEELRSHYHFIILDNTSHLDDISLTGLDIADEIWMITGLDIPAIKNTKLCLEVLHNLKYTSKIKLIPNGFDKRVGIRIKDIESSLGIKANYVIPDEEQLTIVLNKGIPFVDALPRSAPALEVKKMVKDLMASTTIKTDAPNMEVQINSVYRMV